MHTHGFTVINKRNKRLRDTFNECFKLPEWENPMTYFAQEPKHGERLNSWSVIGKAFSLDKGQLDLLKKIHGLSDTLGHLIEQSLRSLIQSKNFKRTIDRLIAKQVIQLVDNSVYTINPSIVWARNWWSPFAQGVLAACWMNGKPVVMPKVSRLLPLYHYEMKVGCQEARRRMVTWGELQEMKTSSLN